MITKIDAASSLPKYDAAIIGGGPAGYAAALRIAELGGKACVIERESLGGICARTGCIPTKALIAKARVHLSVQNAKKSSLYSTLSADISFPDLQYAAFGSVAKEAARTSQQGVEYLLRKSGIPVINGNVTITSPTTLEVSSPSDSSKAITLSAKQILIATGSSPRLLSNDPVPSTPILTVVTSDSVLSIFEKNPFPKEIVVIGAGYIGLEFASLFNALGVKVSLIETLPQLLPPEDPEASQFLLRALQQRGIKFYFNSTAEVLASGSIVVKTSASELTLHPNAILIAIGRKPNIDLQKMDELGIACSAQGIITDRAMRTGVPTIYAAGDVVGKYQLAHVASQEGRVAAENMMGLHTLMDYSRVPRCIFTIPEMASVGRMGPRIGTSFFLANGKAIAEGESRGFVKVYVENEILVGATIIGEHASDLISTVIPLLGQRHQDLQQLMFPHPSYAEAIADAIKNVLLVHSMPARITSPG